MLSFRKKLMSQLEKTYEQIEGRAEGRMKGPYFRPFVLRPYFIGPFQPKPKVQKKGNLLQVLFFKLILSGNAFSSNLVTMTAATTILTINCSKDL